MPLATLDGHAVGGVAGPAQQRRRGAAPAAVGGAGELVVDPRRASWSSSPRWAAWASRCSAPASWSADSSRAPTAAAGRSTCGSGWPNGSARPAAPRIRPAHRGWCTTPARSATRSARASTCTPHRRSPACSRLGHRCSIEPEVDLTGHWIDGDLFHVGPITVGNDATIGARTTLLPNAVIGKNADVAPGSGVIGKVKAGQYWKGSPAMKSGKARHPWPDERPRRAPFWVAVYGVTSVLLGGVPLVALGAGLALLGWAIRDTAVADGRAGPRRRLDTRRHARRGGRLRGADGRRRADAGARPARGLPPGAQSGGLAAVGHRAV